MSTAPYVVVGAGQAGLQVCDSLRKAGYDGRLVLIGEENSLPYQRPPLSKKFLEGGLEAERLQFRPASYYEKIDVDLRLSTTVQGLERSNHRLHLADGKELEYSKLAIATGTRVRPLICPGSESVVIHYIRTLQDADALRPQLRAGQRMLVVGGGFIGLEVAAVARQMDMEVVVIETQSRLMARAVSPLVSEFYASTHRARGVDVRLDCGLEALEPHDAGVIARLSGGDSLAVDCVLAGIGVLPNIEFAAQAGIECRNGIVVDVHGQTNDPDVVAAGDCTMHYNGFLEHEIRLESVQNAVDQAKVAAATMCGQKVRYSQVPWFWSDQYELKLQMAGIGMPHDEQALRGEVGDEGFSVFYFRAGALVGADSINRRAEHMAARKLLAAGAVITPAVLADRDTDVMQLARDAAAKAQVRSE